MERAGGSSAVARAVDGVVTRGELAEMLTALRQVSGRSLRDLGRDVGVGKSTVDDWCAGRRLPFPKQDAAFGRLLEQLGIDDVDPWLDALRRVRGAARSTRRAGHAPYRGLDVFRAEDRAWFFGRDELVARLHARFCGIVESPRRPRLLFVVGASGSGKSSLLHAGLGPRLRDDGHPLVSLSPGAHPLRRLAGALADHAGTAPPPEGADDERLGAWLATATDVLAGETGGARTPDRDPGLVVVVDQFEELFTTCEDPAEQAAFLTALDRLASGPAPPRTVVVGLRIDFYPALVATGQWTAPLQDAQILVEPMTRAELTAAIVEPARRAGITVDDALVELALRELIAPGAIDERPDAGALPLLSHALLEAWHHASGDRITADDYRDAGGIRRAVEESAEHAYRGLDERAQVVAQRMFLRLVNVDPNNVATRRTATRDELAGLAAGTAAGDDRATPPDTVLAAFVDARLVTAHESTVEIAHEALLGAWPRLRSWIDGDREGILLRRRLGDATQVWLEHDRDPSALATGARLEVMQRWADGDAAAHLSPDEHAFLDASTERAVGEARTRRRRTRRLRVLAAATTAMAVLAASLAAVARDQRSDAVTARDEALSRQLALSADALRDTDPSVAAHLALRGYEVAPTAQARAALLETADLPFTTRYAGGAGSTAVGASRGDGLVASSNSVDGTVQLFTQTGSDQDQADRLLVRRGVIEVGDPGVEVYALALTPDDAVLAVGDTSASVDLWDVTDPDAPSHLAGPLAGPDGPVQHLAVSADGTELAASGRGPGIARWDISDPSAPDLLPTIPSDSTTLGVAYSPDGSHIAFGQATGRVRLWRLGTTPSEVASLQVGDRDVDAVAFSPDGRTLAAGGKGNEARAWDIGDPASPTEVPLSDRDFGAWVNATAFSPDGKYLVAGSSDGTLRVWSTADWSVSADLPHPDAITQVAFTRDGATLVSVATDGATRLWDLAAAVPPMLDARAFSLTYSDDGARLAAFSGADTGVWDTSDPDRPVRLVKVTSPDPEAPFSGSGDMTGDGDLLVQGAVDGTVHLVDVTDPVAPLFVGGPLGGSDALVEQAAFSNDGGLVAAAGDDGTVRVWDVGSPERPRLAATLHDSRQIMLNVVWSPAGPLLAANGSDGLTYLYDLEDPDEPELLARLDGFDSDSYASAFTSDGRTLAVGGSDRIVILWDLRDPSAPERIGDPITGPPSRIYDLAFSPGGELLVGAVVDGTAWVWDAGDLRAPRRTAVLGPFDGPAFTVAVSPDGATVAASGADRQIHLWPTDEAAVVAATCSRLGDPLTEDEWTTHMPDEPFEPPC